MRRIWRGALGVAAVVLVAGGGTALAQTAEEETRKQTARQISGAISSRIAETFFEEEAVVEAEPPAPPINAWGTGTFTRIDGEDADFSVDIYQGIFGADRQFGSFFAGLSGAYTRAEIDAGFDDSESNIGTISPYGALVLSENFFIKALVGDTYSSNVDGDDTNTVFTDVGLNAVFTDELPVIVEGRAGHRFSYTELDGDLEDDDFHSNTLYVGTKLSRRFDRVTPYAGAQFEYLIPEEGEDRDIVFVGGGLRIDINRRASVDLSFETEFLEEFFELYKGAITLRIKL